VFTVLSQRRSGFESLARLHLYDDLGQLTDTYTSNGQSG